MKKDYESNTVTVRSESNVDLSNITTEKSVRRKLKLVIEDSGDPSVGIMAQYWEVDFPFSKDDVSEEDMEFFAKNILSIYSEFSEGKLTSEYNISK